MGSLEALENLMSARDCMVLCVGGKIFCGCGESIRSLSQLGGHISQNHAKYEPGWQPEENLKEYFRRHFLLPQDINPSVTTVILPEGITCVCLTEPELGVYASNIQCHLCQCFCENMDDFNKHRIEKHGVSQVLVGQNIIFEKPESHHLNPAFYCPMVRCKYHIAESGQQKYFKTLKLLKQHYTKVHAIKDYPCDTCGKMFPTKSYLDIHVKSCGTIFSCQCGANFPAFESLQTHSRRKAHPIDSAYLKCKTLPPKPSIIVPKDPAAEKLAIIQSHHAGQIPIAPKPSVMHINAAIALSEMSASHMYTPKADIGIQTDSEFFKSKKSCSPETGLLSPSNNAVSAETQTKGSGRKRSYMPSKVSSQVQTMGEFTVKAKKARTDPGIAMGSQCRISPEKKVKAQKKNTVTTMTMTSHIADQALNCHMTIDIPDFEYLWPLRCNTNGTQTSPRVPQISRRLSMDSDDGMAIPELENVAADPTLPQLEQSGKPPLGEIRQFSTETQTELDIFLDTSDWGSDCVVTGSAGNDLPDVEKLLTTEMETQTHEGEENLLFANNCTQTAGDDFLSSLLCGGEVRESSTSNLVTPFKLEYVCSAETQTSLTGFQGHNLLTQVVGQGEVGNNHIETQTQEILDFIGM